MFTYCSVGVLITRKVLKTLLKNSQCHLRMCYDKIVLLVLN